MFTDLGLKYVGPIDGHDEAAVENALRHARGFNAPVIVHVVTRRAWAIRPPRTTRPSRCTPAGHRPRHRAGRTASAPGWTSVFSDELIRIATKRRDIVAITAAMPGPTGLSAFGQRFPDRLFDVGIAESTR